ncbi:39S ribosomal protein L55, mitochondrial isoform X2 [Ischnura elegans]|uniref:39S ribosomal protein L55, mitochondrial isoform X2 n=1 Tax=Ischnura elegans TaxID=197161 RepID=UPI001ED87D90|nr:39S ribosomal protein L55, mitochondrial isoform X2 [Ischnura elegans]
MAAPMNCIRRATLSLKNYFPSARKVFQRNLNCNTASITRAHRLTYARLYPTVLVLPDGSSINIRYHEPRKIITLPVDTSSLSEEELKRRMEKRKPKKKIKIEEDISDDFDVNKYVQYIKKS